MKIHAFFNLINNSDFFMKIEITRSFWRKTEENSQQIQNILKKKWKVHHIFIE